MELLRYVDEDSPDIAHVSAERQAFKAEIQHRWLGGGALELNGCARQMINNLQTRVHYEQHGRVMTACGVNLTNDHPSVRACLRHMRAWVTLALTTLETEYPSFESCQYFNVFLGWNQRQRDLDLVARSRHMERLPRAIGLDQTELARQHAAFRPASFAACTSGVLGS